MDKRTAIYCRSALANDIEMAAQEATLRAYADEHGHTDIVCCRDNGAAGNTLNRPALNKLTADIKAGEIGAVLVVNVSRIARSFPLYSEWRKLIAEHGTALIAIDGGEHAPIGRYGRMRGVPEGITVREIICEI
jgi:site-specific DNA recombinase